MRGGGDTEPASTEEPVKPYTQSELDTLEKYGGLKDISDTVKRAFLIQEASPRCSNDTGEGSILLSDCWAVQAVIRHLIQTAMKRSNSESFRKILTPVKTEPEDNSTEKPVNPVESSASTTNPEAPVQAVNVSNTDSVEGISNNDRSNASSLESVSSTTTSNPEAPSKSERSIASTSRPPSTATSGMKGGGKKTTRFFRRIPPKGKKSRKTRKQRHSL
jgi:hypothetical protein